MSDEQRVPEREWVGGKSNKEITIRGQKCQVGLFTEKGYEGVQFNPLICALCLDSKGETMKINAEGETAADGEEGIRVGCEFVEHEFFRFLTEPDSTATKCMCRCRENFENLEEKCPYYMEQVAQTDPNAITPTAIPAKE